jgi:hypothetical protein
MPVIGSTGGMTLASSAPGISATAMDWHSESGKIFNGLIHLNSAEFTLISSVLRSLWKVRFARADRALEPRPPTVPKMTT